MSSNGRNQEGPWRKGVEEKQDPFRDRLKSSGNGLWATCAESWGMAIAEERKTSSSSRGSLVVGMEQSPFLLQSSPTGRTDAVRRAAQEDLRPPSLETAKCENRTLETDAHRCFPEVRTVAVG